MTATAVASSTGIDPSFFQDPSHRPKPVITTAEGIPLIDLSPLHTIDPADTGAASVLAGLLAQVEAACKDWGFFQVINHGIPLELTRGVLAASKEFHGQKLDEKRRVKRDEENPYGYYDGEHTKNVRDWKEVFDFQLEDVLEVPDRSDGSFRTFRNQWPAYPPDLKQVCLGFAIAAQGLAYKILALIALTLGLPATRFRCYFGSRQLSFVRLNHYPPCPIPQLALGVGRHKDAGALTVLLQDDVGGLDVRRRSDGEWVRVKPVEDAVIINVGDVIQVWSNDKYESAEHRVSVNSDKERFSIPFFLNPYYDVVVKPLQPEEGKDHQTSAPRYDEYNFGDFFLRRKISNFRQLGVENIQIYHFKKNQYKDVHTGQQS